MHKTYWATIPSKIQHATARLGSRELNNTQFSHALTRILYRFEPDTVWKYSRASELLGALIERVARPWDGFCKTTSSALEAREAWLDG